MYLDFDYIVALYDKQVNGVFVGLLRFNVEAVKAHKKVGCVDDDLNIAVFYLPKN